MEPRRTSPTWLIAIAVCAVLGALGSLAVFGVVMAMRPMVRVVERMSSGEDSFADPNQVSELVDELLNVSMEPMVIWDKDRLTVKLKVFAESKKVERLEIRRLTLDDYLPDLKMPIVVKNLEPGRPQWVKVRYPGFPGRGGKVGKLDVKYSPDGNVEHSPGPMSVTIPLRKR